MKKILIMPDSFKGCMTATEVAKIIEEEVSKAGFETKAIPIADGGEGTLECVLKAIGGKERLMTATAPDNRRIMTAYGVTEDEQVVVELARISGLTVQETVDAKKATTYGFGELIYSAINRGATDFLLALGGSATTDCGCGMAQALGARFLNKDGMEFEPTGGTLLDVAYIDLSQIHPGVREANFTVMCDVTNPLFGENGAAYVYGPQKGASKEDVELMDQGLAHIAHLLNNGLEEVPGAGAAGGCGYGCMSFLNGKLKSGIDALLDLYKFDELVKDADLIITGEGQVDEQSLMGKVLYGIKSRAEGVQIVSFCGRNMLEPKMVENDNISIIPISSGDDLQKDMENAKDNLRQKVKEFIETYEF